MPEEHVTTATCHDMRTEIWASIFPRWILLSIGGAFVTLLLFLYLFSGKNAVAASDAMKKAEIGEVKMEHLKEGQAEIKADLKAQHAILMRIDRRINGD